LSSYTSAALESNLNVEMSFHCLGVVVDIFTSPLPLLTAVHLEQDVLAFGKFMMKAEVLSLDCSGPGKEAMQLIACL